MRRGNPVMFLREKKKIQLNQLSDMSADQLLEFGQNMLKKLRRKNEDDYFEDPNLKGVPPAENEDPEIDFDNTLKVLKIAAEKYFDGNKFAEALYVWELIANKADDKMIKEEAMGQAEECRQRLEFVPHPPGPK